MNYMEAAMAPWESHYKALVYAHTWGHLYPEKPQYKGKIRIARSLYGSQGTVILDEKDLPCSSPWWYEAITEFVFSIDLKDGIQAGEVAEVDIQVDVIECVEELDEADQEEYNQDPWELKTWSEIHIKQLRKATIVKAW